MFEKTQKYLVVLGGWENKEIFAQIFAVYDSFYKVPLFLLIYFPMGSEFVWTKA